MKLSAVFAKASWLLLAGVLIIVATAQEYRGRVQGTVADPSQAAVAGAGVTLRNVNTGIESNRETDASGHYLFDLVQPGSYTVTMQAPGFQKFVQEGVTVLT